LGNEAIAILAIIGLIINMLMGTPIFVAFALVSLLGFIGIFGSASFGLITNSVFTTATSAALVTIPAFILMGEILFRSGAGGILFASVAKLVGRVPGRQYVITVVLGAVLGALSGSAMAVTAMLGRTLLPEMERLRYDRKMATGTILAGACLAPIIPPSILAVIAGSLANVSISSLLLAGVLPGILLSTIMFSYCIITSRLKPSLAPDEDEAALLITGREKLVAVLKILPFFATIFSVMGLILFGIATPTEAGATGVVGAIVTAALYRALGVKMLIQSLYSTAKITAMILVLMAAANLFSQLLGFTGTMGTATRAIVGTDLSPYMMLVLMLALPFLLCMFVDQIAVMIVIIPLYVPAVAAFGFDPIWFWMLFLIVISVGALTPPFGYAIFVLNATASHIRLTELYRASWPFVGLYLLGIVLMILFPSIITVLPDLRNV
jgi:tripartite ATP-independent transporter DctM subunit